MRIFCFFESLNVYIISRDFSNVFSIPSFFIWFIKRFSNTRVFINKSLMLIISNTSFSSNSFNFFNRDV